jgi:hypothetical protein
MTARYTSDCCPACGSYDVIPYAVIVGGSEEYGYQCLDCEVTWPVLAYPNDRDGVTANRYHALRGNTDGKQGLEGRRHGAREGFGRLSSPSSAAVVHLARIRE